MGIQVISAAVKRQAADTGMDRETPAAKSMSSDIAALMPRPASINPGESLFMDNYPRPRSAGPSFRYLLQQQLQSMFAQSMDEQIPQRRRSFPEEVHVRLPVPRMEASAEAYSVFEGSIPHAREMYS